MQQQYRSKYNYSIFFVSYQNIAPNQYQINFINYHFEIKSFQITQASDKICIYVFVKHLEVVPKIWKDAKV